MTRPWTGQVFGQAPSAHLSSVAASSWLCLRPSIPRARAGDPLGTQRGAAMRGSTCMANLDGAFLLPACQHQQCPQDPHYIYTRLKPHCTTASKESPPGKSHTAADLQASLISSPTSHSNQRCKKQTRLRSVTLEGRPARIFGSYYR